MRSLRWLALASLAVAVACGGGSSGDDGEPQPQLTDRLLVVRDTGIFELSLATNEELPLLLDTPEALLADPAVSPDGTQIAHVRLLQGVAQPGEQADFGADLYVADRDGSNPRLLYLHQVRGELARGPRWTPDGNLLFSVERFETDHFVTQVLLLDMASGETTVLVENAVQPAISPDGTRIAYAAIDDQGLQSLWVANADGSGPRLLLGPDQGLGIILSPRFSPDGTRIAVAASEVVPPLSRHNDPLYAGRSGGAQPLRRPPAYLYNGFPMDIWMVDLATDEPRKLADIDADQPYLAWSGDGLRLFMLDATAIYAIDPATGNGAALAPGTFHGQLDWLAAR
jgi:Tol biopolymer transport system component